MTLYPFVLVAMIAIGVGGLLEAQPAYNRIAAYKRRKIGFGLGMLIGLIGGLAIILH
jgi:hypothetical protein